VQLTPLSAGSLGLAVVEKGAHRIVVRELHKGAGTYDFDWEVKAVRTGYEQFQVIRPRGELAATGPLQSSGTASHDTDGSSAETAGP